MLRQDKGYDHAVEAERFGEDKNEDHSDEKTLLLAYGAHPCVSHDSDCHACCQTAVVCSVRLRRLHGGKSEGVRETKKYLKP